MPLTAEQQKDKYLAKRACGNCGTAASAMRPWGGRHIPICSECAQRLDEQRWELEYEHEPDYGPPDE